MSDCPECERLRQYGRNTHDPVHCKDCHKTWTGNEAQHCVVCHVTFATISSADAHRSPTADDHINPEVTEGWHERRPGVWTNANPLSDDRKAALRKVQASRRGS